MAKAVLYFLAGVFGALITDVFILIFGSLPVKDWIGIEFAPAIDLIDLLVDLFSGGLWGLLFFLPFLKDSPILKGALLSLIPFAFHVLIGNRLFDHSLIWQTMNVAAIGIIFAFDFFWGIVTGSFLAFYHDDNPKEPL